MGSRTSRRWTSPTLSADSGARRIAGACVVVAVLTLAACSDTPSAQIRSLTSKGGFVEPDVPAGKLYSFDVGVVCTTSGSPVKVDAIAPANPSGGMRVTEWAVQPAQQTEPIGALPGDLQSHGVLPGGAVTVPCSSKSDTDLFVTVIGSGREAQARGFYVEYGSGRRTLVEYAVATCPGRCHGHEQPR